MPPPVLSEDGRSDESTPTRVTPSISSRFEIRPATASWSGAQPTISSAGPDTLLRVWISGAPSSDTEGSTVPASWTSQTLDGNHARQFVEDPLPIEAALSQAGDGARA